MGLKIAGVGPSTRVKDVKLRNEIRDELLPVLEKLKIGGDGVKVGIPEEIGVGRFRSLVANAAIAAGWKVSTEIAYKRLKSGEIVKDEATGEKIITGLLVHKVGIVEGGSQDVGPAVADTEPAAEPAKPARSAKRAEPVPEPVPEPDEDDDDEEDEDEEDEDEDFDDDDEDDD